MGVRVAARILRDLVAASAVPPVKRLSRLLTIVWLMAACSLVGWLLVNLDTAGWILLTVTIGLMTFELTRRPASGDGPARRASSHGSSKESGG